MYILLVCLGSVYKFCIIALHTQQAQSDVTGSYRITQYAYEILQTKAKYLFRRTMCLCRRKIDFCWLWNSGLDLKCIHIIDRIRMKELSTLMNYIAWVKSPQDQSYDASKQWTPFNLVASYASFGLYLTKCCMNLGVSLLNQRKLKYRHSTRCRSYAHNEMSAFCGATLALLTHQNKNSSVSL